VALSRFFQGPVPVRAPSPVGSARSLKGEPFPALVLVNAGAGTGTFETRAAYLVGGGAAIVAPAAQITAFAQDATGDNSFEGTLPRPTLSAFGGANAALVAPTPTLAITGTIPGIGRAALVAPSATLGAGATGTAIGNANLTFGDAALDTYRVVGYSGAVCASGPTLAASGTAGASGRAALTLPLFELVASGTTRGLSSADLLMPAARLGATAQAWLVAPSATLVAIGTATVTATYEAYAVNLNHAPRRGVEPVDEMTRYTNYPFDRIVRYRNSYFGVAADGLYLLEGTTDYADPTPTKIPWDFKTGMTDLGSTQFKTVESAYFGGRLGAATVQLHAGEKAPETYSYPLPTTSTAQNYRQVFGRGVRARYYALGAYGTGTMELDDIDFSASALKRRI
jgi:hypothetical protein